MKTVTLFLRTFLRQDLVHHTSMHIRQTEIPPGIAVRELLVIERHQMQQRRAHDVLVG